MKFTLISLCTLSVLCNTTSANDQEAPAKTDFGVCGATLDQDVITKIHVIDKFGYTLHSPAHVPHGFNYDIQGIFHGRTAIASTMSELKSYRERIGYMIDLWRPIEKKLVDWAPDTQAACAIISGNYLFSLIRGYHELYHFKKLKYDAPAVAETLSGHWVNENLLPSSTFVSLCGVSTWEPGDIVVLHSFNNESNHTSRICPEKINEIIHKYPKLPAQKLAEIITLKSFAPKAKFEEIDTQVTDYITENSGCIVIKNIRI